jgi:DNA-binding winged helix-turn-helix (wHTH) protein/class 3 adenylate cyclase
MVYVFGECTFDTQRSELCRAGQIRPLRYKVRQVLTYLLAHADRVVSKAELCEQVWSQQCISDAALESTIKAVRQAIGDSGRTQQLIQTVYGQGYRLRVAVEERPDVRSGTAAEEAMTPFRTLSTPPQTVHNGALSPPTPGVSGAPAGTPGSDTGPLNTPASVGEWKLVTVLCGAVTEVAAAAPSEPERHYRQVRTLSMLARDTVQQYGGTLHPVVGECIIAVFGTPIAQEEQAQSAVLAALDLQHRVHEASGEALAVRLGVHTGVVAVHGLEHAPMTPGAVVGDTVTGAMALQAHAAPGTVRCSGATARLVRGFVRLVAQEPITVGERSMPMAVYQVAQRRGQRPPRLRPHARPLRPFVGRIRELTILQELFAQVEAGQGQVVGIVGEPGIGKSRLLAEFRRRLQGRRLTYLAGGCRSYGQSTPYLPVRTLLRMHWGIAVTDAPADMVVKVRRRLTTADLQEAKALLEALA